MLGEGNGYKNEWDNASLNRARKIKAISKKHPGENDPILARAGTIQSVMFPADVYLADLGVYQTNGVACCEDG